jgi:hypothetical protein
MSSLQHRQLSSLTAAAGCVAALLGATACSVSSPGGSSAGQSTPSAASSSVSAAPVGQTTTSAPVSAPVSAPTPAPTSPAATQPICSTTDKTPKFDVIVTVDTSKTQPRVIRPLENRGQLDGTAVSWKAALANDGSWVPTGPVQTYDIAANPTVCLHNTQPPGFGYHLADLLYLVNNYYQSTLKVDGAAYGLVLNGAGQVVQIYWFTGNPAK